MKRILLNAVLCCCSILVVLVLDGCMHQHKTSITYRVEDNQKLDSSVVISASTWATVASYKSKVDSLKNGVLGTTKQYLKAERGVDESLLGNLVADAILWKARKEGWTPDMAMINFGGLRADINEGEIYVSEIYELMPFENTLCVVEVDSTTIQEILTVERKYKEFGFANFSMTYRDSGAVSIHINGEALSNKTYAIAISDYLSKGGSGLKVLIDKKRQCSEVKIRELIIEFIKEKQELNLSLEGRIKHLGL